MAEEELRKLFEQLQFDEEVFGIKLIPRTKSYNLPAGAEDEFEFENFKKFMQKQGQPKPERQEKQVEPEDRAEFVAPYPPYPKCQGQ
jgi:hypothetical protein